jgi:hypothetical protein
MRQDARERVFIMLNYRGYRSYRGIRRVRVRGASLMGNRSFILLPRLSVPNAFIYALLVAMLFVGVLIVSFAAWSDSHRQFRHTPKPSPSVKQLRQANPKLPTFRRLGRAEQIEQEQASHEK